MKKELYEIITARKAKENELYVYEGVVYAYGKITKLAHKDRFRRLCKADNYEEKFADDIASGWKIVIVD